MNNQVVVAGVGMIPFSRPGASDEYHTMGARAARAALCDAGLDYVQVEQAYVGYTHGDSASGQAAVYGVGLTGIPIFNLNNTCASGATALFLARQAIASGAADCVIALGFEQIVKAPAAHAERSDRTSPMERRRRAMSAIQGDAPGVARAAQYFGGAAIAYMDRYGISASTFAQVAVKSRRHAAANPMALQRTPVTVGEVLASRPLYGPLTLLQASRPACGAAAAILCTEAFARRHGISRKVGIRGQVMTTDRNSSFDEGDMCKVVGYDMTASAAQRLYAACGIAPDDLDVVELHDCFTVNEVLSYEALGLTHEGGAEQFILDGSNTYGGQIVVNPSGGILASGHAPGANGLAQCFELVQQLRGAAGARQVESARLGLQHSLGLGGSCVVTLYQRHG